MKKMFYAVKIKNEYTRLKSRSGGIFTALTDFILKRKGVIYGCILNEKLEAIHIGTNNFEDRNKMRGSKYVQSRIGNCYKKVKKDLEDNKEVLFSGTPCQVDGLKKFLGKDYENLYCIDIICHGVPSPLILRDYIKWQEEKNNGKCVEIDFRNKEKFGWRSHIETFKIDSKEGTKVIDDVLYTNLFYSHLILRPSCFICPYKNLNRSSDITIGDYWGIEKIDKNFEDDKGVSIVIINNERGKKLFDQIKKDIFFKKTTEENSLQLPLVKPFDEPIKRDKFWIEYHKKSFNKIINKYGKHGVKWKIIKLLSKAKKFAIFIVAHSKMNKEL